MQSSEYFTVFSAEKTNFGDSNLDHCVSYYGEAILWTKT